MRKALILFAAASLLASCSCASTSLQTPFVLKHFIVEADEDVALEVVCDGRPSYSLELKADEPVEIGGPDALCSFITYPPVELSLEAVWE